MVELFGHQFIAELALHDERRTLFYMLRSHISKLDKYPGDKFGNVPSGTSIMPYIRLHENFLLIVGHFLWQSWGSSSGISDFCCPIIV